VNNYYPNQSINTRQATAQSTTDFGGEPFVIDIDKAVEHNSNFRSVIWTGDHLQVALMHIPTGESIGLEIHPDNDQFFRIEEGQALVQMGDRMDNLYFNQPAYEGSAIMIPAGKWHNVINTGNKPLKLYTIYAPPHHPKGTIHQTKAIAEASKGQYSQNSFSQY
jgi:mannose-6-phosphate isomerase-like protein (cupin superfamily)